MARLTNRALQPGPHRSHLAGLRRTKPKTNSPCKLCHPWQYDALPLCRSVAEGSSKETAEDGLTTLSITMCWLPHAQHPLHLEVETCQDCASLCWLHGLSLLSTEILFTSPKAEISQNPSPVQNLRSILWTPLTSSVTPCWATLLLHQPFLIKGLLIL